MAGHAEQNAGYEPIPESRRAYPPRNRYAELYVRVGNHTLTLQGEC